MSFSAASRPGRRRPGSIGARLRAELAPRNPASAATALFSLSVVVVLATAAALLVARHRAPFTPPATACFVLVAAGTVLGARLLRRASGDQHPVWLAVPFLAVGLCWWLAAALAASGVRAEVFLIFPATYAARQLAVRGSYTVIALCLLAALATQLTRSPDATALADAVLLDSAFVACALRLTTTAHRFQSVLVDATQRADTDPLTGLASRGRFEDAARRLDLGAAAGSALLLIDIDHFKQINDRHGHPAGDAVLRELASLVSAQSRAGDLAGRMGGDETALLLVGIGSPAARARAESLRSAVAAYRFAGLPDRVGVSIGLAHAPEHGRDWPTLYAAADVALYEAKNGGRNRCREYTEVVLAPATGG